MAFDEVDRELSAAERAASPRMFGGRAEDEVERVLTASSISSSGGDTVSRRPTHMSRVPTQNDLERHPTALSRIQTARSQHSNTVGRDPRSRRLSKPLPAFGAGKPYPPPLPAQEGYVVEFDGPDDPLHAQNWPMRKKWVLLYCRVTPRFLISRCSC